MFSAVVAVLPSGSPRLRTYDVNAPPLPRSPRKLAIFVYKINMKGSSIFFYLIYVKKIPDIL